ncbi:MAG: hypothetical protein SW833_06475 [Cyanobacteriota bacterium]|nr:hypothetical protein [Cyanobacteriota bacterium]
MSFLVSQVQNSLSHTVAATRPREPRLFFTTMLSSRLNWRALTQQTSSEYQCYVEIAIDVFKARSPSLINSLKDFLTCLPNPKAIELVLAVTIYELAETDPLACRWILQHPDYLMPELDLVALAIQTILSDLETQGYISGRDFCFERPNWFYWSEEVRATLCSSLDRPHSAGERLLLEEILQVSCDL